MTIIWLLNWQKVLVNANSFAFPHSQWETVGRCGGDGDYVCNVFTNRFMIQTQSLPTDHPRLVPKSFRPCSTCTACTICTNCACTVYPEGWRGHVYLVDCNSNNEELLIRDVSIVESSRAWTDWNSLNWRRRFCKLNSNPENIIIHSTQQKPMRHIQVHRSSRYMIAAMECV